MHTLLVAIFASLGSISAFAEVPRGATNCVLSMSTSGSYDRYEAWAACDGGPSQLILSEENEGSLEQLQSLAIRRVLVAGYKLISCTAPAALPHTSLCYFVALNI